ncbi:MAG: hypothetical protein PHG76_11760, partial [Eubacteriales bacterium]|nr:hypothetical protein [Eubacteriales bacterium]
MDMSHTALNMAANDALKRRLKRRKRLDLVMRALSFAAAVFSLVILAIVLYRVVVQSIGWLNVAFLTGKLSMFPEKAGISGVILGSLLLMVIVIPVTLILGVATAVYLEEYSWRNALRAVVHTAIANLAGVPSVIV